MLDIARGMLSNANCLVTCRAMAQPYVALQCSLQMSCGRSLSRVVSWRSSSPPLPSRKFPSPSCMWTTGILPFSCTCSRDAKSSDVDLEDGATEYVVTPGLGLSMLAAGGQYSDSSVNLYDCIRCRVCIYISLLLVDAAVQLPP